MSKTTVIIIAAIALLLMTGCASTKQCEPVVVNKIVTVPCVKSVPPKPALESIDLPPDATLAEQIQAISIDALKLKSYNNELMAIIEGCR